MLCLFNVMGGLLVKREYDTPVYEIEKFLTVSTICTTSDPENYESKDNWVDGSDGDGFDF